MSASSGHSSWRTAAVLAVLVAAAYGASLRNEFVFDDLMFIKDDPRVKSFSESPRLFVEALWGYADQQDGRPKIHQYYRPLQTFPLAVSHAFFGTAAWPAHLLNLFLHWVNCLLVYALFRHAIPPFGKGGPGGILSPASERPSLEIPPRPPFPKGGSTPAFLGAVVFAVHPGYSEAILWISDVAGLGAALCLLAMVVMHLTPHRSRWYVLAANALLYLLGLWFKESGALAPALLLLCDIVLVADRGWRRVWRLRWSYVVLLPPLALYLWLRRGALGGMLPGLQVVTLTGWEMVINAIALLPEFVRTFVWPFDLNMYHDFNAIHGLLDPAFLLGAAVLASGALAFAFTVRSHPPAAFGLAWAMTAALPHLLIRWPQLNVFAERYLYLPAVGLILVVMYAGEQFAARVWRPSRPIVAAVATALVALFLLVDNRRIPDWHDDETIYAKTVTQSPRAELIRSNLAIKYLELGRYDEGIALMKEVIAIDPNWNDAWYNLASLYLAKGEDELALQAFQEAKQRDPFKASTLLNLGYLHDRRGEREAAVEAYLRLVEIDPRNADGWYNLASVAVELRQTRNARAAVERVLTITPDNAEAQALAKRISTMPEPQRAADARERPDTLRRCAAAKRAIDEERFPDAIALLNVAAWYDEASPLPHQYLANAYYLSGRVRKAEQHQREALARDPTNDLYRRNLESLEKALSKKAVGSRQ